MRFDKINVPEMPLPPQPPPEFPPELPADEPATDLRVVALQAAARSVQAAPGDPADKTYRQVLSAAHEYLKWLKKDRAS